MITKLISLFGRPCGENDDNKYTFKYKPIKKTPGTLKRMVVIQKITIENAHNPNELTMK